MARKNTKDETIVGIDVGTTKVTAIVAKVDKSSLEMLGIATVPINGFDSEDCQSLFAIMGAVKNACKNSGCQPQTAYIGISGFVESRINASGVSIEGRVTKRDIDFLLETAAGRSDIPEHLVLLEQVAKPFYINQNEEVEVENPHGMEAENLDVMSHNILCCKAMMNNIAVAANKLPGLISFRVTSSELAAAEVFLSCEDKQNGICLLDIGGEYASLVIYHSGVLKHTASVPWGGNRLNDQIKFKIGKNAIKAEQVKLAYSRNESTDDVQNTVIRKVIDKELLVLCSYLDTELYKSGMDECLNAGIVLTGGTASLPNLAETVQNVLQVPVRMAQLPAESWLNGVSSEYANAIGLVLRGKTMLEGR
jgi:cell division protein FtsA